MKNNFTDYENVDMLQVFFECSSKKNVPPDLPISPTYGQTFSAVERILREIGRIQPHSEGNVRTTLDYIHYTTDLEDKYRCS